MDAEQWTRGLRAVRRRRRRRSRSTRSRPPRRSATAARPTRRSRSAPPTATSSAIEASAFPIVASEDGSSGAMILFWPRRGEDGHEPAMRLKVWGARGSVPAPGPQMNRYGGNTSCVQLTLASGERADPRRRHRDPHARPRAGRRAERIHILLTHLHLDHIQGLMFFPPCFRVGRRRSRSGARRRRRRRSRTGSPATSRRRCRRSRSASCPARSPSATPRRASGRSAERDDPRRGGHPPRADARLPDHRRRDDASPTSPTTSRRSARRSPSLDAGVDLGLRPGQRRRPADPRLPVHRRRVPRARRLGPLGDRATRSPSPQPGRGQAADALPPRSAALRRVPRRPRTRRRAPRWAELGGDATQVEMAHGGRRARGRRRRLSRLSTPDQAPRRRASASLHAARLRPPVQRAGRSFDTGITTSRRSAPTFASLFLQPRRRAATLGRQGGVSDETKVRGRRAAACSRRRAARGPGHRRSPTPRTSRSRSQASSTHRSASTRCG